MRSPETTAPGERVECAGQDAGQAQTEAAEAAAQLRLDGHVRLLAYDGWLHIDRPLPFLCVHRRPKDDHSGASRLVMGQASYLIASADPQFDDDVRTLVSVVAQTAEELGDFGSFLVLEVWTGSDAEGFVVTGPPDGCSSLACLANALEQIDVLGHPANVRTRVDTEVAPPGLRPLIDPEARRATGTVTLGVAVPTFFVDERGTSLPITLRRLHRDLSRALRSTAFEFATVETTFRPVDLRELGPRRLDHSVLAVDSRLADLGSRLDYLLAVTPMDADRAWAAFSASDYTEEPAFHYRPLAVDPDLVKRELYAIAIEEVEDPTLAAMFREKRYELDAHVDLLVQRDSPAFLNTSRTLFGEVDPPLLALADEILERAAEHRTTASSRAGAPLPSVDASTFAARARSEVARYSAAVHDDVPVEERDDLTGVMVSNGRVLIDTRLQLPPERVDALIQHEVGTHVVTFLNGSHQPLSLLRLGTPGYEETQEALAVLAEHIVGGLTMPRCATLAARVLVTQHLTDGLTFVDAFDEMRRRKVMSPARIFDVVMRVYRCGGFTKDVIYLRGLDRLLGYLAQGKPLEPLLVGKLSLEYVPIVEELCWRHVVKPPMVQPRWLSWPGAEERLGRMRDGMAVLDLLPVAS